MTDPRLNADMIRNALKAASSLIVVEVWAPPVHEFEKERRFHARDATQRMCLEALHELNRLYPPEGAADGENAHGGKERL
jgi:hypothetical protein